MITKKTTRQWQMSLDWGEGAKTSDWDPSSRTVFLKMFSSSTDRKCLFKCDYLWPLSQLIVSESLRRSFWESAFFTSILDDTDEILSMIHKGTVRWPSNETQSWGRVKAGILWRKQEFLWFKDTEWKIFTTERHILLDLK